MNRIAIFQDNLDVGGIQKSLANLLRNFDYENYHVDLYLSERKTFWNLDFPPQLHIKYLRRLPRICSFLPFDLARRLVKLDFSDCEEYDLAIDFNSYQFSCALGALTVPAKRRVMWIHNNVSIKLKNEWKYRVLWYNFKDKFKYYDQFVGVSQGVIEPFKECSGIFDKRYTVIQNTIDTREIFTKSLEETDFTVDESKLNFVAIGRLCHQKAYDIMLDVFSRAGALRDDLHLYIIGDGDKRFFLEYQRDSLGLTDKVTFLGQMTNPFKYMDKMDAFVSTSRYEGQPLNVMEAKALGLPLYCTKNLEIYSEGLEGCEDIVSAIASAKRVEKRKDDLHEYNSEIIRRIKLLAQEDGPSAEDPGKTVHIIALHLGVGGVEKAIISMANLFAERYKVEIRSVYRMPGSPAFPLDSRVRVKYLLEDVPNRDEWKRAVRSFDLPGFFRESFKSVRILLGKRLAVLQAVRSIKDGVVITTRHEDNVLLSRYGSKGSLKIAQLHHDHNFKPRYVSGFRRRYGGIDVFTLLLPQMVDEVERIMKGRNRHTKLVYMPNFLTRYPESVSLDNREKLIVSVGRFTGVKRFELLTREFIRIHDQAPDWKLMLIGDGVDLPRIQKLVADNQASDYVLLTGRQSGEQVERAMCGASVYAMASSSEGFPFVLLEAQSCGLPVLAYDVRVGPGFMVHDGEDGLLVPEGDQARYERCLLELMGSPDMRRRMGQRALTSAGEFSKEKVAEKWYSVIEG